MQTKSKIDMFLQALNISWDLKKAGLILYGILLGVVAFGLIFGIGTLVSLGVVKDTSMFESGFREKTILAGIITVVAGVLGGICSILLFLSGIGGVIRLSHEGFLGKRISRFKEAFRFGWSKSWICFGAILLLIIFVFCVLLVEGIIVWIFSEISRVFVSLLILPLCVINIWIMLVLIFGIPIIFTIILTEEIGSQEAILKIFAIMRKKPGEILSSYGIILLLGLPIITLGITIAIFATGYSYGFVNIISYITQYGVGGTHWDRIFTDPLSYLSQFEYLLENIKSGYFDSVSIISTTISYLSLIIIFSFILAYPIAYYITGVTAMYLNLRETVGYREIIVKEIEEPEREIVEAKIKKTIFCTNCGTKLSQDAKFCENCGSKL